jgi:hypothetical protein
MSAAPDSPKTMLVDVASSPIASAHSGTIALRAARVAATAMTPNPKVVRTRR